MVKNYEQNLEEMVAERTKELNEAYENIKKVSVINEKNERLLATLIETIPNPIFYKDEEMKYVRCNSAFERFLGKSKEEIYGKTVYDISPKELADVYDARDRELLANPPEQRYGAKVKAASGEIRDVIFNKAACQTEDNKVGIVGIIIDITEQKRLEGMLRELTVKDALTDLYNRRGIDELNEVIFGHALRTKIRVGILMIDIDFFKLYNDTYGHKAGDECLKKIAGAVRKSCLRHTDFVGRYGGEEFLVVLSDVDENGVLEVADRIEDNVRALDIEHIKNINENIVTVSIGVHVGVPEKIEDIEEFISKADEKLYIAKARGRGVVAF
jgi:diguanylate cyclase (GGDEF)-like protein/PAS domain S-box-containing protein